jgi:hypothetical protein
MSRNRNAFIAAVRHGHQKIAWMLPDAGMDPFERVKPWYDIGLRNNHTSKPKAISAFTESIHSHESRQYLLPSLVERVLSVKDRLSE